MDTKQILYSSDAAASFATGIEGWIDNKGRFFGDSEHMARYSGCTHINCAECGKPTVRYYRICRECQDKKSIERYNTKPRIKWNGKTPLYSEAHDEYFFDTESLLEYIDEHDCSIRSLRLIVCVANKFREIESDYFSDDMTDGYELPADLEDAIAALNDVIRQQPAASWSPGKYAADCDL